MTNNKIWQTCSVKLNPLVEAFTVGDDYIFDQELLPYDIEASIAHAEMLEKIGILTFLELKRAKKGLKEILEKYQKGEFEILPEQEDGHTAIEQYLTEKYGEVGKKIHTGRSRNDQSLVIIRLFMKSKILKIKDYLNKLITQFHEKAKKNFRIQMPGYTHMQKAMPTTVGIWLESFSDAFKDSQKLLDATFQIIDQNPLGSASGFGIESFPLDRKITTQKLNFSKIQQNPMYCGFSRGFFENIVLQTLSQPMIIASKFAHDMLLYTTKEFNFFSLPEEFTTGSSIMPQKRNYDLFEIMRANVKIFTGYQFQIQNIVSSIGSGYQRDLQLTKKPLVLGVKLCLETITILGEIIKQLKINKKNLELAMTEDLYVTNLVYDLVRNGYSFREAYSHVKKQWSKKLKENM